MAETATPNPEQRKCRFCRSQAVRAPDSAHYRLYECCACEAVEVISTGSSWWYFGAYRSDGARIDVDGRRSEGARFGWWRQAAARAAEAA